MKFVLVVVVVAACIYFIVRAMEKRGGAGGGGTTAKPRPVGPDDDPEFLWGLNRKIKDPRRPDKGKPGSTPPATGPADPDDGEPTPEGDAPRP